SNKRVFRAFYFRDGDFRSYQEIKPCARTPQPDDGKDTTEEDDKPIELRTIRQQHRIFRLDRIDITKRFFPHRKPLCELHLFSFTTEIDLRKIVTPSFVKGPRVFVPKIDIYSI